jgi:hypothetical protein
MLDQDPAGHFKEFAERFAAKTSSALGLKSSDSINYTYDVRKTDSLVRPYLGILNLTIRTTPSEGVTLIQEHTLTFAPHEGRWVFSVVSPKDTMYSHEVRGGTIMPTDRSIPVYQGLYQRISDSMP